MTEANGTAVTATPGAGGTAPTAALGVLSALAEEKRLRILELLRNGEHCVCDLVEAMEAGQSLLSHHLKVLREAGLVADRREGRWSFYRLVPEALAELESYVTGLREDAERPVTGPHCC